MKTKFYHLDEIPTIVGIVIRTVSLDKIIRSFGIAIREFRKARGLTQEQLGFEADIQRIYVSKLELGQQQPSLLTIFKLAKGLNCPPTELIKHTEEVNNRT